MVKFVTLLYAIFGSSVLVFENRTISAIGGASPMFIDMGVSYRVACVSTALPIAAPERGTLHAIAMPLPECTILENPLRARGSNS